ncbi:MAG: hypothetical protein U0936_27945 [Planctomycetaceae bacterium]
MGSNSGSAYIYKFNGSTGTRNQTLKKVNPTTEVNAAFGEAADIDLAGSQLSSVHLTGIWRERGQHFDMS